MSEHRPFLEVMALLAAMPPNDREGQTKTLDAICDRLKIEKPPVTVQGIGQRMRWILEHERRDGQGP